MSSSWYFLNLNSYRYFNLLFFEASDGQFVMQFSTSNVKEDFSDFCFVKSLDCSTLRMSDYKVCLIPSLPNVLKTLCFMY